VLCCLLFSFPAFAQAPIYVEQSFDTGSTTSGFGTQLAQVKSIERNEDLVPLAKAVALKHGLNQELFMKVINCESSFNPNAVGDNGHSYGLAQINLPAHPEVSKEQATDPNFALGWMANQWEQGRQDEWTCYRNLYE
jgi:soluble lytic murein transglycosylase-like protein